MDLQLFLAINVIAVAALIAIQSVFMRQPGFVGWLAVNLLVAAVTGGALVVVPEQAGFIGLGLFLPLVVAPAVLSQLAQRRSNMGRYGVAARFARLAALLHPTAGARFNAALSEALAESEQKDDTTPLIALMRRATPEQRATIETLVARSKGRWDDVLAIVRTHESARKDLKSLEVRALGESGRLDEMTAAFSAAKASLVGYHLLYAQLFVLAFAGRRAGVEQLLASQLSSLEEETKAYWRAIAALNSADGRDDGVRMLDRLAASAARSATRHAARHHLDAASRSPPAVMSAAGAAVVAATERQVAQAAEVAGVRLQHVPATMILLGVNLFAFAGEIAAGGSENLHVLVEIGALWPPLLFEAGEWWRLVTPSFLHFGPIHLIANMLMLLVLGRLVEATLGARALLLGYLAGGVGSTATVLALMRAGLIEQGVLVGASGAIFALFGMIVARAVVDWRRWRDELDRRRLVSLATVMALQFVIDVSVPQISMTAHLAGFAIGLVMGYVVAARQPSPAATSG